LVRVVFFNHSVTHFADIHDIPDLIYPEGNHRAKNLFYGLTIARR